MHVVFLESSERVSTRYTRQGVDVTEYPETTFLQLADRCRHADVIVTTAIPLRREILDYVTRPKHIIAPQHSVERLVERAIAAQLEIQIHTVDADPLDWSAFREAVLALVSGSSVKE
ncbi:MAG: hypothetical protein ACLFNQ_01255 [Spirochaetaceae bacterium]